MKYEDLEIGMVVESTRGSAMFITGVGQSDTVFEGKDNVKFLDVNDSYHGQCYREVHKDEVFTVLEGLERDEVVDIIFKTLLESQSNISDCISMIGIAKFGDK